MICPLCGATVGVQEAECLACGVGLVDYATVWYLPDRLVNDGLACLRDQRAADAATLLARACGLRPDDEGAHRAWAYACQLLGRHEEAVGILHDALGDDVESDHQFADLREALSADHPGVPREGDLRPPLGERASPDRRAGVPVKRSLAQRRRRR